MTITPSYKDWEWQDRAACDLDTHHLFFREYKERKSINSAKDSSAKSLCASCPVRRKCLDHSIVFRESYGLWGGVTEEDRRKVLKTLPEGKVLKKWDGLRLVSGFPNSEISKWAF